MWYWYLCGILVVLLLLYLIAIMPRIRRRPDCTPLMGNYYAHRGLHNNKSEAPENSMAAFQKAVQAGFGIEMDVQLTKDLIPVVFHDESLKRVCGVPGNVRDYTFEELQQFPLCGSQERIPKFQDFLNLVHGQVPLIIEIKIHEDVDKVCTAVDQILNPYQGVYCMESFNSYAVNWYHKNRPEVIRGQLSSNFRKEGIKESMAHILVHYLLINFIAQPDFIAYNHLFRSNLSRILCRKLYGILSVAWTIRSQEELDQNRNHFDLFIFQDFIPK